MLENVEFREMKRKNLPMEVRRDEENKYENGGVEGRRWKEQRENAQVKVKVKIR